MFSYRGLVILIALCAFGAIQASFAAREEYHRSKHGGGHHHGNHNGSSNSSGHWNGTHHGGNSSGHWNVTQPGGNSSSISNSSYPGIYLPGPWHGHHDSFNKTGNSTAFFAGKREVHGKRFGSGRPKRAFFYKQPSYGRYNASRPSNQGQYQPQPQYRPQYPVYRPAGNWSRPGNKTWNYSG